MQSIQVQPYLKTSRAVDKLKVLSDSRHAFLRIGVKSRGCSGLVYSLDYVNEKGKLDEIVQQDGIIFIILWP